MSFANWLRNSITVSLIFILAFAGSSATQAQGNSAFVGQRRAIEVEDTGIPNPTGLAFSSRSNAFHVVGGRGEGQLAPANTDIMKLTPFGLRVATARIAAAITDPINMALDNQANRLLILQSSANRLIDVLEGPEGNLDPRTLILRDARRLALQNPQGMTVDPVSGHLFILDTVGPRIVRVEPEPDGGIANAVISEVGLQPAGLVDVRGLAFDPTTSHLHLLSLSEQTLYELTQTGRVVATRDLSEFELSDPQSMVFAPSGDLTDDPSELSLYVTDSGGARQNQVLTAQAPGEIVELSFIEPLAAAASTFQSSLIQTIDAWQWSPPSPDSAGVVYLPTANRLLVADSEVNEMPPYFTGDNVFEATLTGNLIGTLTTISFSDEPTGVTFNPSNEHLFFSDDTGTRSVYEMDPGPDGLYDTPDDIITSFATASFGSSDPEGVTFANVEGVLFVVDGVNREVYRVDPGANGIFDGVDDQVTSFDTLNLGLDDPEGIALNPNNGNLYVVGKPSTTLFEITTDGALVQTIDISAANARKPAGLAYAPSSQNPIQMSIYIAARGVDNGSDPNENDGKVYEMSLPPGSNNPPVANNDSATTTMETPVTINVVANDTDVDGNLNPASANTTCANGSTGCANPTNGTLVNNGDGTFDYTPNPSFTGNDSFIYEICDTDTLCDTAVVGITVIPPNDPPVANDDSATTPEDTPVAIDVAANDTDPDGNLDPTSANTDCPACTQPSDGTLVNNGDGTFDYTPNPDFNGQDSFVYGICDTGMLCDIAMVTITVDPVNDPPVAVDDNPISVDEDSTANPLDVLANDTDPDLPGDTLSITAVGATSNGGTVTNNVSNLSYTPAANFQGVETFTYTVSDGALENSTATVTVTVNNVNNDPPVAVDDNPISVDEDSTANPLDVLANDTDPDLPGDTLSITAVGATSNGGTVTNNVSNLSYTPAANFQGVETFTYTVSDGALENSTATVTVTVNNVNNDPPVAVDDNPISVDEDSTANPLDVLANDTDPDLPGDTLSITAVGATSNGGTVTNNVSNLSYTPAANFQGVETFTYTVSDGALENSTATVTVTVNNVNNDPPVAVDDNPISVDEDSTANPLDVLANDTDPDLPGDTLSITAVGATSNGGTVTNNVSNLSYTPAANFQGVETFTYTVSDGALENSTATVMVTVNNINDPPVAVDDNPISVDEDSTANLLDVLANDTDPDLPGDTLSITAVGATSNGGTVTNNVSNLSYTPAANFQGVETFTYTVSDGALENSTATVTVTVNNVNNDPPVAVDDNPISVDEDSTANPLDVLANDTDPDLPGDTLSITAVGATSNGGTVTNNVSNLSYTPAANFQGVETFTYTVSDGALENSTATVTVTVNNVNNDPPVAVDDNPISVDEDSTANPLDVLANDTDPDLPGDTLSITAVGATSNGGTVTNNVSNLSYTPAANFQGVETFTYTVSDGALENSTATVTVTVNNVNNDPPVAVDDNPISVDEDSTANPLDVLANDTDPDLPGDTLSITAVGATSNGGTVTNNVSNLSYTPAANFQGVETFTYTVSDGALENSTATVTVTVNNVNNDPPVAVDDNPISVDEDSTANPLDVLANDTDPDLPGDTLSITAVGATSNGGTVTNNVSNLSYTPAANFQGVETFTYTVSDGALENSTATVTVTVNNVNNDPPVAVDDNPISVDEDSTANPLDVLANDTDPDLPGDTLSITAVGATSNGGTVTNNVSNLSYTPAANFQGVETFTYTVSDGALENSTATVTVTVNNVNNDPPVAVDDNPISVDEDSTANPLDVLANDTDPDLPGDTLSITAVGATSNGGTVTNNVSNLSYTPAANFQGVETFTYTVSDGALENSTATVTVTVNNVNNDPPMAVDDNPISVDEDSTANPLDVLANDTDPDLPGDTLSITAVGATSNGGTVTNNVSNLSYTPAANFQGVETFTYTVSDGALENSTATVTVTVNNVNNDPPVAVDDNPISVDEDSTANPLDVLANDTDPDLPGDTLSITAVGATSNGGTVTNNVSNLSYTPAANFQGVETFTYTVSDGALENSTATVTVTVNNVNNDPPVAVDDNPISVDEDSTANPLDVLANDTDPDLPGDTLSITAVGATSNGGTVTNNVSNLSYTPAANFQGVETFTYTVSDGALENSTATVTVTVNNVNNDPPVAVDDNPISVDEDSTANPLDVLANDTDPDLPGDTLSITAVGATSNGGTVTNNVSNLSYTPAANFQGVETFTYTVSDGALENSTATVMVTVNNINDPPVAVDDNPISVDEDSTANLLDVLANDTDPDLPGDTLSITAVGATSNGGTVTNNVSNLSYTPAANFQGVETFTYTVSDGALENSTATVTVTVNNINDPPVAVDDIASTEENTAVLVDVVSNDTDPDGDLDPTSANTTCANGSTGCVDPANGGLVNNLDGSFDYTPDPWFNGPDSFVYEVCDSGGVLCDTAIVNISVNPSAPVIVEVRVSASDDDAEERNTGKVGTTSSDLELVFDRTGDQTVGMRFNGTNIPQGANITHAYIQFQVDEANSVATSLTIEGEDVDNATTFIPVDGSISSRPRTAATVSWSPVPWLTRGEAGPDQQTPNIASVIQEIVTRPGWASGNSLVIIVSGTGERTAESFNGNQAAAPLLHIEYSTGPPNEPPMANNDSAITTEDTPVTIDVAANDTDPEGSLNLASANTTCPSCAQPGDGGLVNNGDGSFGYTPNQNFNGPDSFVYEICDTGGLCDTAIVNISVNANNDPPVANDDSASTTIDTAVTINVAVNDTDPDGNLNPTSVNTACAICVDPVSGTLVNNGDGTFDYTPSPGFNGADSFVYEICDTLGECDTAMVSISVNANNEPPMANNDSAITTEDTPVTIDVAANDTDPEGNLDPASANTTCGTCSDPANGSLLNIGNGTFEYTPYPGFNGPDSFVYEICDTGGLCDTAAVSISVNAAAPMTLEVRVAASSDDAEERGGGTISLASSDLELVFDAGVDQTVGMRFNGIGIPPGANIANAYIQFQVDETIPADPTDLTIQGQDHDNAPTFTTTTNNISSRARTTAAISWSPAPWTTVGQAGPDQQTPNIASVIQEIVNRPGWSSGNSLVIIITGTGERTAESFNGVQAAAPLLHVEYNTGPPNDPPMANNDSAITTEDTPVTIDVAANDTDPEGSLNLASANTTCATCSTPANGSLVNNGDGSFDYTPSPDFNGQDSFVYEICDTIGACDTAPVSVTVTPIADPPVAIDDSASTTRDTLVTIDVAANDTDPDGNLDPASANTTCANGSTGCADPTNGTLVSNGDGTFDYTPNPGFNGSDSFVYEICDTLGACDTATVSISVNTNNDPPVANDDSASTPEDTAVTINVAANDTDPDGNLNPASANTACATCADPANGSLLNIGNGMFEYTPYPGSNGPDSFVYEICDTGLMCDTATVSISVNAAAPMTLEVRVAASSDDAEERVSGSVKLSSSDLELVFDGGGDQTVGMRFNGISIPPGANITSAYIQFQVDTTNSEATTLTIEGEATDNASQFVSSSLNISSRPRTDANVPWSPVPWTTRGEVGPDQMTPDISWVIQEIVNLPNWASGNSLVIIITGTGERTADSYDGNQAAAPLLHIEYTL